MIFASNNQGKIREIKSIFTEDEIVSLSEANVDIEVIEDADSFYGNALKKAQEIYGYLPIEVQTIIADETGLPIERVYGVATFMLSSLLNRKVRIRFPYVSEQPAT